MEKQIKSRIKYFMENNIQKSDGIKILKKEFPITDFEIMEMWFEVKNKKYPPKKRVRLKDEDYIEMKIPKKYYRKVMDFLYSLEI